MKMISCLLLLFSYFLHFPLGTNLEFKNLQISTESIKRKPENESLQINGRSCALDAINDIANGGKNVVSYTHLTQSKATNDRALALYPKIYQYLESHSIQSNEDISNSLSKSVMNVIRNRTKNVISSKSKTGLDVKNSSAVSLYRRILYSAFSPSSKEINNQLENKLLQINLNASDNSKKSEKIHIITDATKKTTALIFHDSMWSILPPDSNKSSSQRYLHSEGNDASKQKRVKILIKKYKNEVFPTIKPKIHHLNECIRKIEEIRKILVYLLEMKVYETDQISVNEFIDNIELKMKEILQSLCETKVTCQVDQNKELFKCDQTNNEIQLLSIRSIKRKSSNWRRILPLLTSALEEGSVSWRTMLFGRLRKIFYAPVTETLRGIGYIYSSKFKSTMKEITGMRTIYDTDHSKTSTKSDHTGKEVQLVKLDCNDESWENSFPEITTALVERTPSWKTELFNRFRKKFVVSVRTTLREVWNAYSSLQEVTHKWYWENPDLKANQFGGNFSYVKKY